MMKKISLFFAVFLCFSGLVFGQSVNIDEYFPPIEGTTWVYEYEDSPETEYMVYVHNVSMHEDGMKLVLTASLYGDSTDYDTELHGIRDGFVYSLASKVGGRLIEMKEPYPIELALPGKTWRRENDRGYSLFQAKKGKISFAGFNHNDCIVVERRDYLVDYDVNEDGIIDEKGELYATYRTYYSRHVGLVYSSNEFYGMEEKCTMRLNNIALIKN